jgi:hypothetical protein
MPRPFELGTPRARSDTIIDRTDTCDLPPHHQPRRANAPDTAIEPTAKERAVDRKINNICRGC